VNAGSSDVSILLGNGDGTFLPAVNYSVGDGVGPNAVVAGDFNGDGNLDLAITDASGVAILIGNGDGSFQPAVTLHAPPGLLSLAVADFNGDGNPDIAVAWGNNVGVYLSNGDGSFKSLVPYAAGNGPNTVIAADLNGDGFQDLAVVNSSDGDIGILLGNGDGTFQPQVTYPVEAGPNGIAVGDFDGDGKLDLAVANNSSSTVSLLLGNGDGTFQAATNYATGLNPGSPAAGDFNNDGRLDLVVPDFSASAISVLLQTPVATLSNNALSFGSQPVGETSAAQTVSLSNTGSASLNVSAISSAGPNAGDFAVTNTCGALPASFAPSTGCTINVTFTPSMSEAESAAITITDNAAGGSQIISLSGSATSVVTTTMLGPTILQEQFDEPITLRAVVTPAVSGTPTGTVTFTDGGTTLGTVALTGGTALLVNPSLTPSLHLITATYSGDANFLSSTSNVDSVQINKAMSFPSLTSSANPSAPGQPVTFTVTVSPPPSTLSNPTLPTGTVVLKKASETLATLTLIGGQASFTTSPLAASTFQVTAQYGGDSNFLVPGVSALTQVVKKGTTTTTVTSSLNPSLEGQSVTFTGTVSSSEGTPADGEIITFTNGSATLGTGILASGSATFTTSALTASSHSIKAKYPGDTEFLTSTSAALTQTVGKYGTTTTLGTSGSPSSFGQSVTFTASVTSASGEIPTGTVTFKNGTATLEAVPLTGGVATFGTATLTVATHSITAVYNGDASDATSTSSAVSQVVTKAETSTSLISSLNPSSSGQPVSFIATVTSSTSGTPTGSVIFKSGTKTLGSEPLSAGVAILTTSLLAVGTNTITATYNGSTDFAASVSDSVAQVVNP
jgi:hypothetical protein